MRICFTLDINSIMSLAEGFQGADKEGQKALFLTGLNILRESLLKRSQLEELMRTAPADREFVENFSLKALTEEKILQIYRLLNAAHYHLERNANAKILFADLSFDMAKVLRTKESA